jgi:tetratricopeptide (TPR) repeat protein
MGWAASTKEANLRQQLFDKAIKQYQEAQKLNPKSGYTYSNWAYTLFCNGKYAAAWQMVKKARELGSNPDQKFIKDLTAKFPEPK